MTYAKRILSMLLVLCLLGNTAITVFASDTDGGGEELPPIEAATEEPAPEEPPPEQGEEPPSEPSDEEALPDPEESAPPEETEEVPPTDEEAPPTESTDEEAAPEEPTEDVPPEESVEDTEEVSELPAEETPAEEVVVTEEEPTAEITAANDIVMPMATGLKVDHMGNQIITNGTFSFTYYSYLARESRTASMAVMEEKQINGAVAYCIEPEVTSQGTNYTEAEQQAAWLKVPTALRQAIVLTMAYGYPQEAYSADPNDIYWYGNQNMLNGENYIGTQLIIWEFMAGLRSSVTLNLTGSASFRNVCDGGWATIRSTYDAVAAKLANHNALPAYAGDADHVPVYELKYNKATGTYRYLLPADKQSEQKNCDIQLPDGIRYLYASDGKTVIGFEATVAAAESLLKNGFTASGETPFVIVDPNNAVACWTCDQSQTVVTLKTKPDPAKAYFTLKLAAAGSLTGLKTTSVPNGSVEGFRFKFYSWTDNREWYAKTDAAGNLCLSDSNYSTLGTTQITGLSEGKYDMLEVLSQDSLIFPDSWTVTVTDADGNTVSNKTYTPTKESNGNYAIRNVEITGLAAGGTVTMTINNAPLEAPLEIKKTSPNGNVKDIEFYVTDASGNEVGRDVTDANGKIEIEGLRIGQTYTVTEIVPEGSICENNNQQITIQAGTNTVTFVNTYVEDLEIVKTSPNGNVKDIEFYVTDAGGKEVGRDVTDADGKLVFPDLVVGQTYTVTEVVPEGSVCEDNNQQITIQTGTNTLTFVNHSLILKLVKESPDGNNSNISFRIYAGDTNHANGKVWKIVKTDANGTWTITGIPAGVYWIREVVPDGYTKQADQRIEVTTANTENNPAVVTFVNKPITLKIVKESPDGNNEGITFQIFKSASDRINGNVWQTVVTGEGGSITLEKLTPGTYWVREIVPQGYASQEDQSVTVTTDNTPENPATVTFVNVPLSAIKVIKTSPDGNVEGITFQLFEGDLGHNKETVFAEGKTDANGEILFTNLDPSSMVSRGVYWVREIVPEGYAPQEDQRIVITAANTPDNPAVVTFDNIPLYGSITVNKVNTADTPLAGATFLLEYSTDDGTTWTAVKPATEEENGIGTCSTVGEDGTVTTGEDGQAKFENLIVYGVTYRLTETVAPAGYQLLAEPVFTGGITANEESSYEIYRTVVNVPLLQMPPTGGDGSVRIIGMVSTLVAAASICALTLLLRKRKENG